MLHSLVDVRPHFVQDGLLLSIEELLGVGQVEKVDLKRERGISDYMDLRTCQISELTNLDMWCDGRRGPEVGEVAVVPEDELGEDDVLDDGVEEEVGEPHEAAQDGAEQEA